MAREDLPGSVADEAGVGTQEPELILGKPAMGFGFLEKARGPGGGFPGERLPDFGDHP